MVGYGSAHAAELYRAATVVTGQGEANRATGFATCLAEVLVKVSGDPSVAGKAGKLAADAGALVAGFTYRDLMAGIPVHDEQGTRERPYALTVTFDRAKVDAALGALGLAPWPQPRPPLSAQVEVQYPARQFHLTGDGERGRDLREALLAAADRFGLDVVLPLAEGIGVGPETPASSVPLAGTLVWSDAMLGWTARWVLTFHGREHRWSVTEVSFDDAFRSGLGGALEILSGNGAPDGG